MMLWTLLWELLTGEILKHKIRLLKGYAHKFKKCRSIWHLEKWTRVGSGCPKGGSEKEHTTGCNGTRDLQHHRYCSILRLVNVHRVSLHYLYV